MRRLLLVLLLAPLAACGTEGGVNPVDPEPGEQLPIGEFVTESLPDPFGPIDRARVTFRDGEVSFSATCNSMSGTARVDDGVLEVDDVGGTEMGCPGAGHEQDEWLVGFLTGRPRLETLDVGLSLTSGGTTLRLLPPDAAPDLEPQAPLQGTRWRLTGIEEVDGDAVSLRSVRRVRAELEIVKGAIRYDTGCNSGGGTVRVRGDVLLLSEVVTTLRGCTGERGEVERGVMAVLGRKQVEWSVNGQELRLTAGPVTLLYTGARDRGSD